MLAKTKRQLCSAPVAFLLLSVYLSPLSETVCRIDFVGVREDYRRQFVGDLVIKAIEDKAKNLGIKTAVLETPDTAVPFFEFEDYENMGKTEDGKTKMRKDLTKEHKCRGCM